ncbi:MAG TPA: hypothetical protein VMH30_01670 [Verrucomicrobiae bacterium]|nr:hypothetical protein [Verrucomicrobiae bacterium]
MKNETGLGTPRFAIINGLRFDFDKSTTVAAGQFLHIKKFKETIRPVLLKTTKGNFFSCWENSEGDVTCFEALKRENAFKLCCDLDPVAAEKEFSEMIQDG